MRVPGNIDLMAVRYRLMFASMNARSNHGFWIAWRIVGHNIIHVHTNIGFYIFGKCFSLSIRDMKESKIAVTLADTDYNLFVSAASNVLSVVNATDEHFVHLYCAVKQRFI